MTDPLIMTISTNSDAACCYLVILDEMYISAGVCFGKKKTAISHANWSLHLSIPLPAMPTELTRGKHFVENTTGTYG